MAGNPCLPRIDLTNRGLMPPCSFLILGDEQSTPPAGPDIREGTGFGGVIGIEFGGELSSFGLVASVLPGFLQHLVSQHCAPHPAP